MGLFGKSKKPKSGPPVQPGQVLSPHWGTRPNGKFFRLTNLDPEEIGLTGRGGIYVLWHGGVRPAWVYLGQADDLAAAMHNIAGNKSVMQYDNRGGLFVTWSFAREDVRDGILLFLKNKLQPEVDNPDVPSEPDPENGLMPIPTVPPGMKINVPGEDADDDF